MNVALYLRYSSANQTEQSIEGQNRVCRAYCEREGHTVVASYIDRATSAYKDTDKRSEFQRMIRDSEKHTFEAVIVYKLDRFARNRYDSATYKAKLTRNGVKVISATENISDSPEGIILESVLEGMAEFYSKELSQKINRGLNESALKGQFCGGRIPLGYKIENKKYVIDPYTSNIVKELFDLYANGSTINEIINTFATKGYRNGQGKPFTKNSFDTMLRNELYTGVYTYKDIRIEDSVPAIIDKETFEIVRKRMAVNKTSRGRGKAIVPYYLQGKMFCGCGQLMVGDSGTSRNGTMYHYYSCAGRKRSHSCTKKSIPKDWIETVVAEQAIQLISSDMIETLADMAVNAAEEEMQKNTLIPELETRVREADSKLSNLIKFIETGVSAPTVLNRIKELESEKADLLKQLDDAKAEVVVLDREQVIWWLERFTKGDIQDADFRRHILDLMVNSVTVSDSPEGNHIRIAFNIEKKTTQTDTGSDSLLMVEYPTQYTNITICPYARTVVVRLTA